MHGETHAFFLEDVFICDVYSEFMEELYQFKSEFDPYFFAYVRSLLDRVVAVSENTERMQHSAAQVFRLAQSGKRLRSFMIYVVSTRFSSDDLPTLFPLMCALELFHLFGLIHDDILDGDTFRRHMPTLHVTEGISQAMLWGDMCFSFAYESLISGMYPQETQDLFSRMCRETILGQMLDSAIPSKDRTKKDQRKIRILKTSRYTFVYPILLAFSVYGITKLNPNYKKLGEELGVLFQWKDDIRDGEVQGSGKAPARPLAAARGLARKLDILEQKFSSFGTYAKKQKNHITWQAVVDIVNLL
jgi:geranylgeranyl pyrophosphate synthase